MLCCENGDAGRGSSYALVGFAEPLLKSEDSIAEPLRKKAKGRRNRVSLHAEATGMRWHRPLGLSGMSIALLQPMFPGRPGRIRGFDYLGLHRYSLTICTSLKR